MKYAALLAAVCLLICPPDGWGDAGVLLPRNSAQPNPAVLSLEEMEITIHIDNGDARVFVRQVFTNHTPFIEEGNYIFALPSRATISDFAVWDGPTRIAAVILERKRAEEIYNSLRQQAIDPGLLQMGERSAAEATRSAEFSAKITPIPAYGTKRMEIEYHQSIPVESLKSYFAIPLRPDAYQAQTAGRLTVHFELRSSHAVRNFQLGSKLYPVNFEERTAHVVRGTYEGRQVNLTEDFSVRYDLDPAASDTLQILTHRNPVTAAPSPDEVAPVRGTNEPGFFEAVALTGLPKPVPPSAVAVGTSQSAPRSVIILFDTSLSMQWEKLERSYEGLEKLLRSLTPADRFNLLLFNTEISPFQAAPVAADSAAIQKALDFVRASRLRGGTDLQAALDAGLSQCGAPAEANAHLVLISDGGATRGTVQNGKLAEWYASRWKQLAEAQRPRTYIFAVGDDANLPLMRLLSRNDGVLESVLSTEPLDFKLDAFLAKIGRSPIAQLRLEVTPPDAVDLVYPLQDATFAGSAAAWVGQYKKPESKVAFAVHGVRDADLLDVRQTANLPAESSAHPQLPRLWARARVDALLEKIEREGEDAAAIDEIIRLARKYKFVTPYTSFLAVPRALLRPRVIRPGDPVLRVKTDESIVSVVALFPFGLTKPLRRLPAEDVWQTRFLAPDDMQDGTYQVRLILRDRAGRTYRESKSFVIASTPPVIRIALDRKSFHRGESIAVKVNASKTTRTLVARLDGAVPVSLRWNQKLSASTGDLIVPAEIPAGTYHLRVIGEDIAHNTGTQEVAIEILP